MDDPRGNLTLTYLAIVERYRPTWVVWENVPGVLSIDRGWVFGAFLRALGEFGYGFAYRICNAQYFGVPQRRRRVFVVGYLGDWRRAAAVLFERYSLSGNTETRRGKGKEVAGTLVGGAKGKRGYQIGAEQAAGGHLQIAGTFAAGTYSGGVGGRPEYAASGYFQVSGTVASKWAKGTGGPAGDECQNLVVASTLRGEGFDASEDGTGKQNLVVTPALTGNQYGDNKGREGLLVAAPIAFHGSQDPDVSGDVTHPVGRNQGLECCVAFSQSQHRGVRRLTPVECERLQGFPDDYTLVPFRRGKPAADGPRYKAIGNSMAVSVMRWIGERISEVAGLGESERQVSLGCCSAARPGRAGQGMARRCKANQS